MTRDSLPGMGVKPLNSQQKVALQLLLDGYGKKQIQEKLNVSQPTLHRWQKLPAWHIALEEAVRGEQKEGEMQMRTLIPLATKVTHRLLMTGADNIKLGAARLTFETVARLTEREDQREVLGELESRLQELQGIAQAQGLMAKASTAETDASEAVIETDAA